MHYIWKVNSQHWSFGSVLTRDMVGEKFEIVMTTWTLIFALLYGTLKGFLTKKSYAMFLFLAINYQISTWMFFS
jgi:hypothetical protein